VKKAAVVIVVFALLMLTIGVLPVLAEPTNGQKVPVKIKWAATGTTTLERNDSDGLSHRILKTTWNVQLFIDDAVTPLYGTAVSIRQVLYAYAKLQMAVYNDDYVISFPTEEGGFEGSAHLLLTDYAGGTNYNIQIHGLFHGTDAFEGQTLNVGVDKGPASFVWEGYLLKP
jgi:hypothetical protein